MIRKGMDRLLERIRDFSAPMESIVTEDEMNAVLDSAQGKFKILDIVAPIKPLMILSLNNSHSEHNSGCGVAGTSRSSVILVYHPRDVSLCDRVFIFAHEIGHALHMALTGDMTVIPDRFDEFNEALGIEWETVHQKQEAFADVAAFAILNSSSLKEHLPHQSSEVMLECCDKYIGHVTGRHLNM